MRTIQYAIAFLVLSSLAGCQNQSVSSASNEKSTLAVSQPAKTQFVDQIVEASCGQCQFGMEGSGCDLAVRIDGKSYYVDGSSIDNHGDAHGDDGLCNCIRNAKVTGEIKDGRFVSSSFELVPSNNAN